MAELRFDLSKLKTSWTKYDIVRVMDVITSEDKIDLYKSNKIEIDKPILRSFLGIKKMTDPTPSHWIAIQAFPEHKKIFALLAVLFTHGNVIRDFADIYSNSNRGGVFRMDIGKRYTNIRRALIESGVAASKDHRSDKVPYHFSDIYTNGEVGNLFKRVLQERIERVTKKSIGDAIFYKICKSNNFHKALGLSFEELYTWLEGNDLPNISIGINEWLEEVEIVNFFSMKDVVLDFRGSKEVYFLGENGDGKSLMLMATYLAFNGNYILNNAESSSVGEALNIIKHVKYQNLTGIDGSKEANEYSLNRAYHIKNLFAYGTHRGRYSTDKAEKYGFMSLFSIDQQLCNPITWLMYQKAIEIEKELDERSMFPEEKSYPLHFSISFLESLLNELLEKNVRIKVAASGVQFIEKGQVISFSQLSEGYRSILIFVVDLMIRLTQSIQDSGSIDLQQVKGVVLIDEIDQHLHPRWQKEIVNKLRKIFSQVQFIMTTHSPTIIQGASEDALIYRVFRDKDTGETKISEPFYRNEMDDLMINSLVTHPMFGLETARLDKDNKNADTSDNYFQFRISKEISKELDAKRKSGANFITDDEIDSLIKDIMKKELGNDKDK